MAAIDLNASDSMCLSNPDLISLNSKILERKRHEGSASQVIQSTDENKTKSSKLQSTNKVAPKIEPSQKSNFQALLDMVIALLEMQELLEKNMGNKQLYQANIGEAFVNNAIAEQKHVQAELKKIREEKKHSGLFSSISHFLHHTLHIPSLHLNMHLCEHLDDYASKIPQFSTVITVVAAFLTGGVGLAAVMGAMYLAKKEGFLSKVEHFLGHLVDQILGTLHLGNLKKGVNYVDNKCAGLPLKLAAVILVAAICGYLAGGINSLYASGYEACVATTVEEASEEVVVEQGVENAAQPKKTPFAGEKGFDHYAAAATGATQAISNNLIGSFLYTTLTTTGVPKGAATEAICRTLGILITVIATCKYAQKYGEEVSIPSSKRAAMIQSVITKTMLSLTLFTSAQDVNQGYVRSKIADKTEQYAKDLGKYTLYKELADFNSSQAQEAQADIKRQASTFESVNRTFTTITLPSRTVAQLLA